MTATHAPNVRLARAFFALNALIFFGMLLASLFNPREAAAFLGVRIVSGLGGAEFMVAFGAIPSLLATAFSVAFFRPTWRGGMLLAGTAFYGACVAMRLAAALRFGSFGEASVLFLFGVDCAMLSAAHVLRLRGVGGAETAE